jgi:PTH1 family peptidyl-tRNA hydrolase
MLLFVGLGNPEAQYMGHRHNIGFVVIQTIAKRHGFPPWRRRFHGIATEGTLGHERVVLLLPETFMNESGRAVREAAHYLKIELNDITVFHDEIELPAAKLRVKVGGSDAGHNGLRSITEHLGNGYRRVRIGVGRPPMKADVHRYVLSDFAKSEKGWVDTMCEAIADNAPLLAKGPDSSFQNKIHLAMDARGYGVDAPDNDK